MNSRSAAPACSASGNPALATRALCREFGLPPLFDLPPGIQVDAVRLALLRGQTGAVDLIGRAHRQDRFTQVPSRRGVRTGVALLEPEACAAEAGHDRVEQLGVVDEADRHGRVQLEARIGLARKDPDAARAAPLAQDHVHGHEQGQIARCSARVATRSTCARSCDTGWNTPTPSKLGGSTDSSHRTRAIRTCTRRPRVTAATNRVARKASSSPASLSSFLRMSLFGRRGMTLRIVRNAWA